METINYLFFDSLKVTIRKIFVTRFSFLGSVLNKIAVDDWNRDHQT